MMQNWVFLIIIYGLLSGTADVLKKKSLSANNNVLQVLAGYSLISFLMTSFEFTNAIQVDIKYILLILLKSTFIFISWILSFNFIKKMPISIYGVLILSRILFSTMWGVIFLGELLGFSQILGGIVIILGLVLVNLKNGGSSNQKVQFKHVAIILTSCMLATLSGLIDKIAMRTISSGQLQFWFMFFVSVMYWGFLLIKKDKIEIKKIFKNYWIYLLALCLILSDRALFIANSIPESKLSVMALVKQVAVIVTVVVGGKVFKEKNILYRLLCSLLVISGISIVVLF